MTINYFNRSLGNIDPSNLIPDANGFLYDTLSGKTYYIDEVTGEYVESVVASVNKPAVSTNVPVTRTPVSPGGSAGGAVAPSNRVNPSTAPVVGGNAGIPVSQSNLSRVTGDWATSISIIPALQNQLGLNNISFAAVSGMLGLALVLLVGGGSYSAYRYGRR